jgi:uncharacterized membrane protein
MLDSLLCALTSVSFLTTRCSFTKRLSNVTLAKDQLVVRQDMDANEHERLSNVTLVKEQLIVRKDMGVNQHKRLSNITLRHKLR